MDFMGGRQGFYSQQEQDDEIMSGPSSSLSHYTTGRSVHMADDRPQKFQWGWPAGRNSSTAELLHADQDRGEERWSELGATLSAGETAQQQQQQQHREHMFDKVVTPSDVGKLNRLVIPKQHAEKYFPLDPSTNDKGLLLNFEDRTGKPWRFRYSYWNSSQSYVMTKGWSRFVKEKRLDAGDIVSFHRGLGDLGKDRLYIDWRRRPDAPDPAAAAMGALSSYAHHQPYPFPHLGRSSTWGTCSPSMGTPLFLGTSTGRLWDNNHTPTPTEQVNYNNNNYNHMYPPPDYFHHQHRNGSESGWYGHDVVGRPVVYQPAGAAAPHPQQQRRHPRFGSEIGFENCGVPLQEEGGNYGTAVEEDPGAAVVLESVPVLHGETAAAGKWLRLFGVNISSSSLSDQDDECEVLSSSAIHPPLHPTAEMTRRLPLQLNFYDDGTTPVLQLNKGNPSASQSSLDLDV